MYCDINKKVNLTNEKERRETVMMGLWPYSLSCMEDGAKIFFSFGISRFYIR